MSKGFILCFLCLSLCLCHAELFCMGFSFAAFFFFVLITRTTELDYDSEFSPLCHMMAATVWTVELENA